MSKQCDLSFQQKNLFQQGYQSYTPKELRQIEWGLRFTPAACSAIAVYGLVVMNPWILLGVASLGMAAFMFPAGHPMDLIYNHGIRHIFGAVSLPPNPFQRRLACLAAGVMNTMAAGFFFIEMPLAAYITGGMLLVLQVIVITTHFCTLSWMYEGFMRMIGKWSQPIGDAEALSLLGTGALLVDVRGPDEFSKAHLGGAENFPLDDLDQIYNDLKNRVVLLYCSSGTRSQIAAQRLRKLGLHEVHDLGTYSRGESLLAQANG